MAGRKRAPKGAGTVYYRKSDGRWAAVISVETDLGERKRVAKYAFNRDDAYILLARLKDQYRRLGGDSLVEGQSVSGFAARWMELLEVSKTTIRNRQHLLDHHILPYLGAERLTDVTTLQVLNWMACLKKKDIGGRTRQMCLALFRQMCKAARLMRVLAEDPTVGIPMPRAPRKEIVPFTRDEVGRILSAARGHRYEAIFALALLSAMRQEEIFGLQWGDIDWEARTLRIHRAVVEAWGEQSVKEAKTQGSHRVIPLHPYVLERLASQREVAARERGSEFPWVFFGERGCLVRRSSFGNRQWKPLLVAASVPHRGMHHTRHTLATILLQGGTPVHMVSGLLGHSLTSTTTDIYSHFMPEDRTRVASAIDRDMSRALPRPPAQRLMVTATADCVGFRP